MSKFQSTISTVAALASIFGAGAAGWKLAQQQPEYKPEEPAPAIEQKITQLEQKIEDKLVTPGPAPAAVQLPPQSQLQGSTPAPVSLPPVTPTPAVPAAPEAPPAP